MTKTTKRAKKSEPMVTIPLSVFMTLVPNQYLSESESMKLHRPGLAAIISTLYKQGHRWRRDGYTPVGL